MSVAQEVVLEKEKDMGTKLINPNDPSSYGCEILLEKSTLAQMKDKSFPTDARIITYIVDGEVYQDLTRCRKVVDLFDLYYDKYGPGSVQKIDFGYGTINPKNWGYNTKNSKKKK